MHYLLNGGRNERGVLHYDEIQALYAQLGVTRILCIPYAIKESFWQRYWQKPVGFLNMPGITVQSLTIYDTDPAVIKERLAWADFIYMPGGSQQVLLERIRSLGTEKILKDLLKKSPPKLLGGGSAGAMVMGAQCIVGRHHVETLVPGLNLLPDVIVDSHFSNRDRLPRLQAVLKDHPTLTGMGLDEDTAVLLDKNGAIQKVFGPGTINICTPDKNQQYDKHFTLSK